MSKAPINTKSSSYARDRETFLKELRQFNESKGISNRTPIVNGKEIDLYLFYLLVTQRGGVGKVNQQGGWDTFLRQLRLPSPCVNGAALLRRIYGASLEKYERARGPPGRDDDNDMEDDYRRGRGSAVPRYVHTAQADWNRWSARVAGPSERLALSLLSPMPNEQDFAVNVCTVLAADISNRLPLATTPHILDFLLAHAGVYNHPSLRDTIGRSYRETRGLSPDQFWRLRAGGEGARELADETKFLSACSSERANLMVQALAAQNTLSDRLLQETDGDKIPNETVEEELFASEPAELGGWMTEADDEEQLFAPELRGGARCVYTQRVMQVASIVRSLSFHEDSLPLLARHTALLRFLLLCANCWVGSLRQMGLDTLGNIAQELVIKDPATCLLSRHVLSTVQAALVAPDRARVLAALELLNKLAQNESNEEVLLRCLDCEVYAQTCALLTLRDIMLLVCTLECVYALTSLGERACERAVRAPGLMHTLVSLLTVEAQSYGPKACILMRVVETVSGPAAAEAQAQAQQQPQPATQNPRSQSTTPVKRQPAAAAVAASAAAASAATESPAPPQPPAPAPVPAAVPTPPPPVSVQSLHAQQQQVQENEQFALAWLRATYEPCPVVGGAGADAGDLYRQYVQCCQKMGRKGLIAPAHFPRLVRSVFGGTVGPNNVPTTSGDAQLYVGIRTRGAPARTPHQVTGPASPILKAQLTSSKQEASKPGAATVQVSMGGAPPESAPTAAAPSTSNTSLIKHLLAHKVSATQPSLQQVAQRQSQQQRLLAQPPAAVSASMNLNVDPEELIKCSTITSSGVSSTLPAAGNQISRDTQLHTHQNISLHDTVIKSMLQDTDSPGVKAEQVTEATMEDCCGAAGVQSALKSSQNKMLADLLEKKSSLPVQVPTIQITESGHIVQVKPDPAPATAIVKDAHSLAQHFVQIKNEQGQIIHFKNDQGQIIQIKNEQGQIFQIKNEGQLNSPREIVVKNEQGQLVNASQVVQMQQGGPIIVQQGGQVLHNSGQIISGGMMQSVGHVVGQAVPGGRVVPAGPAVTDTINLDPDGEPPAKKSKTADSQVESVSKTAANLYAALAASALEDEEDLVAGGSAPTPVAAAPPASPAPPPPTPSPLHMSQPTLQVQQPVLQVQPLEMAGVTQQILLQDKPMLTQTQYMQQPMQIVATPSTAQGGLSYMGQNLAGGIMQPHKTIIIVQGGGVPGGPITLTVNNAGGLDEATLNSLISQASEAITQQHMMQGTQKLMVQKAGGGAQLVAVSGTQQLLTIPGPQQVLVSSAPAPPPPPPQQQQPQPQLAAAPAPAPALQRATQQKMGVAKSGGGGGAPVRQVIRQPVMVGNTKIGEREIVIRDGELPEQKTSAKPAAAPAPPDTPWMCHWKGCGKTFESASGVFGHAARAHCPPGSTCEAPCLWADCDRVPRKTFALLNHLHDRHCTADALRAAQAARARHADAEAGKSVALVYPPNAALAALNKHAVDSLNPRELMDDNEGPVTKSIRLTAALILRNLVIYSNTGRRQLRIYEHHLSTIALSSVEASRTIAQVLYDMNNI